MTVRVKLCGLAREEDYRAAVDARPDALGFIFWARSPRAVTPDQVAEWVKSLPAGDIRKVGVFVDPDLETVQEAVDRVGLDVVQLHGQEDAAFIRQVTVPVWKALHADRLPDDWETLPVEALVLDSGTVDMPGGTGRQVDLARAKSLVQASPLPVWLAGGLKARTVGDAVRVVRPFGVDVSSGVEAAPGVKDASALRAFVTNARTESGDTE